MADNNIALAGFNILPIGFSSHEKATMEAFFRLANSRAPHWVLVERSSEARMVLFNATSQQDVNAFKSLVASWQHVVIIGASDFGTGWAVIQRPLKLTAILNLLNAVVTFAAPVIAVSNPVAALQHRAPQILSRPVPAPATFNLSEAPSYSPPVFDVDILLSSPRKNANDVLGRVLIVDDSDIALKYMQNRLQHFGYSSELAKSGEEALVLAGNHSYHFVFLDVMMEGMDGYKTCRAIKNNKAHSGRPPVVVMLTSRGGTIDKIRGAMAGCDAYLTKPLNEKQLALVLKKYDDSSALQRWDAVHPHKPLVDKFAPKMQ